MSHTTNLETSIAIIGMAGRFPGAATVDELWGALVAGREGISHFTEQELREAGVDPSLLADASFVPAKGWLADADSFDADFFGISPREADVMDPQHRVFLECAVAALESAAVDPATVQGRVGIFAGASMNTYLLDNLMAEEHSLRTMGRYQTQLASDKDHLATRAAYKLGLTGPAITVQTACSTSLVAVHLACQSLLSGECDIALAGGVSVNVPLRNGYLHEPGGILSADGHCRPFDERGDGTVIGNGVGLVVLKRAEEAVADVDGIRALVLGSAINNDGAHKVGYTAPSVEGQAEVIGEALAMADVPASSIGYVEAHGTATPMGDPIEVAALERAYRSSQVSAQTIRLGSVKGNLGHLDAASGVTGLIKAVLCLQHGAIPPTMHFTRPNPQLQLEQTPFRVVRELEAWPRTDVPRRAAVSSFGIGGTNAHLVLEEAPVPRVERPARESVLVTLSARSPQELDRSCTQLADHLEAHPNLVLEDVARTMALRRQPFDHRCAVVATDHAELVAGLRRSAGGRAATPRRVAFVFPGQGAQYPGMARGLAAAEPVFREALERCLALFEPHVGPDLAAALHPQPDADQGAAAEALRRTALAQPALFCVEHALARTLMTWGVQPACLVGHSIGEYVAACTAGMMELPDAVAAVAARARFMQECRAGSMLSVLAPAQDIAPRLGGGLWLAAVNSPTSCVVSGDVGAVEALASQLAGEGIGVRRLETSHAFHSGHMEPAASRLVDTMAGIRMRPAGIAVASSLTGGWMDASAAEAQYWGQQLLSPVRFAEALGTVLQDPDMLVLEVGPGHALTSAAHGQLPANQAWRAMATFPRRPMAAQEHPALLEAVGNLWSLGVPLDRDAFFGPRRTAPVDLPTYPFRRVRHWVDPHRSVAPAAPRQQAGLYTECWQQLTSGLAPRRDHRQTWLVLGDDPAALVMAEEHRAHGGRAVVVTRGEGFLQQDEGRFAIDPRSRADHESLLRALAHEDLLPERVLHLWTLPAAAGDHADDCTDQADDAFASLVAFCQAWEGQGDVRVDVVTRGVFGVTGAEALVPGHAALLGPCLSIPAEVAGLELRLVDLDEDALSGADRSAWQDLAGGDLPVAERLDSRLLARRNRRWWARGHELLPPVSGGAGPLRLQDRGRYVISGGLGGVGTEIARAIASAVDSPVLGLLGRTSLPPQEEWDQWLRGHSALEATSRRITAVRDLEALGAEVVLLPVDVVDAEAVAGELSALRGRHGSINGVVHAAGLPTSGPLPRLHPDERNRVIEVKLRGAQCLLEACRDDDLDFALLCSSRTALVGGPGQADYVAANACLDALACRENQQGAAVVAVDWDTWRGTGMAAGGGRLLAGDHPLVSERRQSDGQEVVITVLDTQSSWIVDEHRMVGHGLVPGTAYLEIVRAALAPRARGRALELHDVMYTTPVVVPDGMQRTLHTTLQNTEDGAGCRFRVSSLLAGRWVTHAQGTAVFVDAPPSTVMDRGALLAQVGPATTLADEDALRHSLHLDEAARDGVLQFSVTGRWRSLARVHQGSDRVLAELELPAPLAPELADYQLHPALMDIVAGITRSGAGEGYYLPFGYDLVRIRSGFSPTMNALLTLEVRDEQRETIGCDADIRDLEGNLLVEVRGFLMKRIHDPRDMRQTIDHDVALLRSADSPGTAAQSVAQGMDPLQAGALLMQVLSAVDLPASVATSATDITQVREVLRTSDALELAEQVVQAEVPGATHPRPDLDTPYMAPCTQQEQAVARIFSEVLGIEGIGLQDDFFALGGHSLAAVQIGAQLRSQLGADLDLGSFFESPTVAHTVSLLGAGTAGNTAGPTIQPHHDHQAVDDVDAMSDEEVEAMLRQMEEGAQGAGPAADGWVR